MSGRRLLALAGLTCAALVAPASAAAQEWVEAPLPVPPGSLFQTPSGIPGDLTFLAPNRGLMTVGGNNTVPEGLYSWDGVGWHQLATVCGAGANARIAWAGPTEFWTIARPSLPREPAAGRALCHFRDGEVIGSFSTVAGAEDPYHPMFAAACNGPSDCWFAGVAARDGAGSRSGGFHLRWDGSALRTIYAPQGRAVSDLLADGGRFWESTHVGGAPGALPGGAILREPEDRPRLLHRVTGETFANDDFVPATPPGARTDGSELRALDGAAGPDGRPRRWAVGGGATFEGVATPRRPFAARLVGDAWTELALTDDPLTQTPLAADGETTFGDVAAIPGSDAAWVTVLDPGALAPGGDGGQTQAPVVARIAADGAVRAVTLGAATKGAAVRIACPAADDCWVATARGYLYRLASAPAAYPRDTDPAFQGTITRRPNEAAEQSIPDDPPQDDSLLLAPPIESASAVDEESAPDTCRLPKLITRARSKVHGTRRLRLVISFRLARTARVGITARRGGRVVARARPRTLRRGERSLSLRVQRARWPTRLSFVISNDSGARRCAASSARTAGR